VIQGANALMRKQAANNREPNTADRSRYRSTHSDESNQQSISGTHARANLTWHNGRRDSFHQFSHADLPLK
jgi:hypothetical protein